MRYLNATNRALGHDDSKPRGAAHCARANRSHAVIPFKLRRAA
jgi:hypothetical protein